MNISRNEIQASGEKTVGYMDQVDRQLTMTIHVISVGAVEQGSMVHDALLEGHGFRLSIATDYRALWATSRQEGFHVAVLHRTLSTFELEEACRFIRQTWPQAKILVIRAGEDFLDDCLYDERVMPKVAEQFLHSAIERLADRGVKRRVSDGKL
jgi:hypothetical protein